MDNEVNIDDELTRLRRLVQCAISDLEVAIAQEEPELASHYIELAMNELASVNPAMVEDDLGPAYGWGDE